MATEPVVNPTFPVADTTALTEPARASQSAARELLRSKSAVAGLAILAIIVLSAVFAPLIAPFDPTHVDPRNLLTGPSATHLFGTDELGRDLFSRTLFGGRISLAIGLGGTTIAMLIGFIWGAVAAIGRPLVDEASMRFADAAMAIPLLMFALMMASALGASERSLLIILGILNAPLVARWTRAAIQSELKLDYVVAARAYGASKTSIIWREVFPNILAVLVATAMIICANVILLEATLSFLGLGVSPPAASWGTLVHSGYLYLYSEVTYMVFPGLMIVATLLALSMLASRLQTVLGVRA